MSASPDEGAGPQADASAGRGRRRPSALAVAGLVLLLVGVSGLGWVGYAYVGTDLLAGRRFDQERQELHGRWQAAGSTAGAGPSTSGRSSGSAPEPTGPGRTAALLRIPRFGAGYEVPVVEGTDLDDLAKGVGHYRGTASAGAVGNFALAGHRVTHGEPFAKLLGLDRGDQVVVETGTAVYTYVLDTAPRDLTVAETAGWVLDPVPGEPTTTARRRLITLTTCQDLFRSADRSVAFGHLASTQNK